MDFAVDSRLIWITVMIIAVLTIDPLRQLASSFFRLSVENQTPHFDRKPTEMVSVTIEKWNW